MGNAYAANRAGNRTLPPVQTIELRNGNRLVILTVDEAASHVTGTCWTNNGETICRQTINAKTFGGARGQAERFLNA